ncbi:hypothetical protein Aduo_004034 [Ancylostoma duodenale]
MTFRVAIVVLALCSPPLVLSWDFDDFPKGGGSKPHCWSNFFLHHPKCKKLSYSCELEAYANGAAEIEDGESFIKETFPQRHYYYLEYEGKDSYTLFEEAARKWDDEFKKMKRKDIFGCSGYLNGTDNKVVCLFGKA